MIEFQNTVIYLIGFAGVGKRTIATEICAQTRCRLIDNHTINNVVFPFVHDGNDTLLPEEIWPRANMVRKIALDTMIEIGNRDFSYVFTNQLRNDDPEDLRIYNQIKNAAQKMEALFVPVRLLCDAQENKKRIVSEERAPLYKNTNAAWVDTLGDEAPLYAEHQNLLNLDVTSLTKEQSAQDIISHVQKARKA